MPQNSNSTRRQYRHMQLFFKQERIIVLFRDIGYKEEETDKKIYDDSFPNSRQTLICKSTKSPSNCCYPSHCCYSTNCCYDRISLITKTFTLFFLLLFFYLFFGFKFHFLLLF